jgi:hypothetical protein
MGSARRGVGRRAEPRVCTVAETSFRTILGDAGWEAMPEPAKQVFTSNGAAIVAESRGGLLDVSGEQLGTIVQPTLLVAGTDSPPAFAEVTNLVAAAMPSAKVEWSRAVTSSTPHTPPCSASSTRCSPGREPR